MDAPGFRQRRGINLPRKDEFSLPNCGDRFSEHRIHSARRRYFNDAIRMHGRRISPVETGTGGAAYLKQGPIGLQEPSTHHSV
jgi:hypothetical protein